MTQLIKKASSGIKFDSNKRYVNKYNKQFGKGVWYRDSNNNGFYDKGEQLIKPGNRIRNNDFSYSQLNSDGTITGNSQIEIPKIISWWDAKNAYIKSTQNLKRQQYNQSHNTKPSKTKLLKKRRYNN